jgi:DNA-binding transcriptional MerR regulator
MLYSTHEIKQCYAKEVIDVNLISKKDLLAITGISYGQLYRWKRERLIPEEWFIKQSAYTGQETFFPRDQILSRIQSILDLKDKYSLEELARLLSPETNVKKITIDDLQEMSEIKEELLKKLPELFGREYFEFLDIVFTLAVIETAEKLGLSDAQREELLKKSIAAAANQKSTNVTCTVFYADHKYFTAFTPNAVPVTFDDDIEIKDRITLSEIADRIKIKYKNRFL